MRQLATFASHGARPDLARSILGDAAFYASEAEPRDPARAVLTAAIALELDVKQKLIGTTHGPVRELVQLLLESPRDYSLAASALFDKPLRIVLGTSLRERDKSLFKRIDKLFQRRNDVAHRGKPIGDEEANEHVKTAFDAFRALREISTQRPSL